MKLLRDEKKRKWQDKERYRPQGPKQEFWSLESSWRRERVPVLAERKFNKLIHSKIWLSNNKYFNRFTDRDKQDTPRQTKKILTMMSESPDTLGWKTTNTDNTKI